MAMMECPNCGEKVSDKAKKCVHCGAILIPEVKKYCQECGTELETEAEVCPNCGCPVEEKTETVPQQVEVTGVKIARKSKKTNVIRHEKHTDMSLSFYHILEYIDTHSGEQLEVCKLAQMCNMSYSNFARLFRDNYGRSCKEYIQYIRLNKAQDLLINSDLDLDYIAQETGFFDSSHFI